MDIKIEKGSAFGNLSGGLTLNSNNSSNSDSIANQLSSRPKAAKVEEVEAVAEFNQETEAATLSLSNVKNYLENAESAVNEILRLRTQQLAYAYEAQNSPQNSHTDDLNDAVEELQTEIERVSTSSSYNGINPFSSGTTLTTTIDSGEISERRAAYSLGSLQSIATDYSIDLTTQDNAIDSYSTLYDNFSTALSFADGVSAVTNKSFSTNENTIIKDSTSATNERQVKEISQLSNEIANKLGSPFNSEIETQILIEASVNNLDPVRVQSLLAEED
jgi:hypothetical protein